MQLIFRKRPQGVFSSLLCWWTGGEYFHVGLLFEHGTVIECNPDMGVISFALGRLLDPDRWSTINIPLTEYQTESVKSFLFREIGCDYDWFGLLMVQTFGFGRESKTKWFCSELAVATLQRAGLLDCGKPCHYSPNRLYKWATTYRTRLT